MKRNSRGMTLIELVVVVAILAVLAMIVIPKLDGIQSNANHAVGGTSASDTARYMQTYKAMKNRFPDGWDSLMSGADLWAPANPGTTPVTRGLHTQLSGTSAKLTKDKMTADDVTALNSAGIYTVYNLGVTTDTKIRPGDLFNAQATIATDTPVATLVSTNTNAAKIINHIYRDNLKTGGVSGTIPTGSRLLVFGLGPHNAMIGKSMMETPSYPNVDATLVYNRNLVIFEVVGTKATFKAVVGADGDLLDDLSSSMNKDL